MSRNETSFRYIVQEHQKNTAGIIRTLAHNKQHVGIYTQAVSFQDHAVGCWGVGKKNDRLYPLLAIAEDKTKILGTGVVLLNILNLCELIEVENW